jgi:hypothetical protein
MTPFILFFAMLTVVVFVMGFWIGRATAPDRRLPADPTIHYFLGRTHLRSSVVWFVVGALISLATALFLLQPASALSQECPAASSFPAPGSCNYQLVDGQFAPDPSCSPGEAEVNDPYVLQHEGQARRCKPDKAVHRAAAKAYDVPGCGEVDHYIPLCLGGSNGPKNLWCQQDFKKKDKLEAKLCRAVFEGKLSLAAARVIVMDPSNWK